LNSLNSAALITVIAAAVSASLTGTLTLQIINPAGAAVQKGCGSATAVRVF
jgi:hypothetical protein